MHLTQRLGELQASNPLRLFDAMAEETANNRQISHESETAGSSGCWSQPHRTDSVAGHPARHIPLIVADRSLMRRDGDDLLSPSVAEVARLWSNVCPSRAGGMKFHRHGIHIEAIEADGLLR